MSKISKNGEPQQHLSDGAPMPIVTLNRWILLAGIVLALLFQQPWITTLLFLMLAATLMAGERASIPSLIGKRLFAEKLVGAEYEDRRLMRFNNSIAAILLGLAQLAFVLDLPIIGWVFSVMVALAAGVALSGFCIGCYLFFRFRMLKYRILGR